MVNTKNKAPLISAITTHYKYTRKRRLSPIRLLGSPQATIHYGEVTPIRFQLTQYVLVHL